MMIRTATFLVTCALTTPLVTAQAPARETKSTNAGCGGMNTLTPAEKSAGWQLLFDGISKTGWHGYNKQDTQAWTVEDCALKTSGTETNYGSDLRPDLVTDAEYTNFELSLEWKGSKAATAASCTASSRIRSIKPPG